jgi:hypothetical protein
MTLCGCGDAGPTTCARPETPEPTPYQEGSVDDGGIVYTSSTPEGELLYFPGGAHYQIFHNLAAMPTSYDFYLSFERFGVQQASLAQAAGNQVEVKAIDEESITVVNGTCADFYLLGVVRNVAP